MPEPEILNHSGNQIPTNIHESVSPHVESFETDTQALTSATNELKTLHSGSQNTGPEVEASTDHDSATGKLIQFPGHQKAPTDSDDTGVWESLFNEMKEGKRAA